MMVCVWTCHKSAVAAEVRRRIVNPLCSRNPPPYLGGYAILLALVLGSSILPLHAADSGALVVVVYNSKLPESKRVAEYYAERRQVPASQVLGFDLPVAESMTRSQFLDDLQKPLMKRLEASHLLGAAPA